MLKGAEWVEIVTTSLRMHIACDDNCKREFTFLSSGISGNALIYSNQFRSDRNMVEWAEIRKYAKTLGREFRSERVILFGSYARGLANEDSDVDLLVIMDQRI